MVFLPQGPGPDDNKTHDFLYQQLRDPRWTHFDVAVAWIRIPGLEMIETALIEFLDRGGVVRIVVGIDFGQTPLATFQRLEQYRTHGQIEVYVFHDTIPSHTFHPKVYRLYSDMGSCLITGSSNLTHGGLHSNYEASLAFFMINEKHADIIQQFSVWFEELVDESRRIDDIDSVHALRENPAVRRLILNEAERRRRQRRQQEPGDDVDDDEPDEEDDPPENPFSSHLSAQRPNRSYGFPAVEDEDAADIGAAVDVEPVEGQDAGDADATIAMAKYLAPSDVDTKNYINISSVARSSGILPPLEGLEQSGRARTRSFTIRYNGTDYTPCYLLVVDDEFTASNPEFPTGVGRNNGQLQVTRALRDELNIGHIMVLRRYSDGPPPIYEMHTLPPSDPRHGELYALNAQPRAHNTPLLTQEQYDQLFP